MEFWRRLILLSFAVRLTASLAAGAEPAATIRDQLLSELHSRYFANDYAGCLLLLEKLRQIDPEDPEHAYNLACMRSRLGQPEAAIHDLKLAIDLGWADFRGMERDADLTAVRALPAFKDIRALNDDVQRRRAGRLVDQLRSEFGADLTVEVDHDLRIVFAAKVEPPVFSSTLDYLRQFERMLRREMFDHGFEQYVAVVIPDPDRPIEGAPIGFYQMQRRLLVARGVGRELNHEFTHAVHISDMEARGQMHAAWIVEGFAVFFESGRLHEGRWIPEDSHRLNEIQKALREDRAIPFSRMARMGIDDLRTESAIAYPQVGAILRFLHEAGVLRQFYRIYTENFLEDPTGLQALSRAMQSDLATVESRWREWTLAQTPVAEEIGQRTPYVGLIAGSGRDGLLVKKLAPDSPLAAAGLRPGDVIEIFDERRITESQQFLQILSRRSAGDVVSIQYRRGGERHTTQVKLKPRPESR